MRAIEIEAKTDMTGRLKIDYPLQDFNRSVRVIILIDDKADDDQANWLSAISENPAFDFLREPEEDIYTTSDGTPFHD